MSTSNLRWLATNLDYLRVPLNSEERSERQGPFAYWGANGIVDYVDAFLINEPVVLIGEDGAPFFDRHKPVAFLSDEPIWPNNHIHVLKPDPKVLDARFCVYFLNSVDYSQYINGSTRDKLTQSQLGSIRVSYPDLATQKAIADFLDRETARIDQLIEKRESFHRLVDEKHTALVAMAINGSILREENAGRSGWFGRIPAEWETRRAKFLFRERDERSESGDGELLTVSHLTGVTKRSEKDVTMFLAESFEGYKLVFPSDVAINTMWAWMGAMGIAKDSGFVSPSYGVYRPTGNWYLDAFLDMILRSAPFVAEVNRRSKGIYSSRLRLYPDAFLDIEMPLLPLEEQSRILEALESALSREEKLAALNSASVSKLREFRSSLITAAVTGQLDIAAWAKRGETERQLEAVETAV